MKCLLFSLIFFCGSWGRADLDGLMLTPEQLKQYAGEFYAEMSRHKTTSEYMSAAKQNMAPDSAQFLEGKMALAEKRKLRIRKVSPTRFSLEVGSQILAVELMEEIGIIGLNHKAVDVSSKLTPAEVWVNIEKALPSAKTGSLSLFSSIAWAADENWTLMAIAFTTASMGNLNAETAKCARYLPIGRECTTAQNQPDEKKKVAFLNSLHVATESQRPHPVVESVTGTQRETLDCLRSFSVSGRRISLEEMRRNASVIPIISCIIAVHKSLPENTPTEMDAEIRDRWKPLLNQAQRALSNR